MINAVICQDCQRMSRSIGAAIRLRAQYLSPGKWISKAITNRYDTPKTYKLSSNIHHQVVGLAE